MIEIDIQELKIDVLKLDMSEYFYKYWNFWHVLL